MNTHRQGELGLGRWVRAAAWVFFCGAMVLIPGVQAESDSPTARATDLRCEALTEPLGVGVETPRLSWLVEAPPTARGVRQSAYQILVAGDPGRLDTDHGDLWDSGKVDSEDTFGIRYAGKPLATHQYAFWKVRLWDQQGRLSLWSPTARWSTGVRASEPFPAEWVGLDAARSVPAQSAEFGDARWIWHAPDQGPNKPAGHRLFVNTLKLPANVSVARAELLVTGDDSYTFTINGSPVATPGPEGWKRARLVDVAANLKPGVENLLRVEVNNATESPAGLLARLSIELADGRKLAVVSDPSWKSTDQPGANWHDRPLDTALWPAAAVVGSYGDAPWGKVPVDSLTLPPAVFLRGSFEVAKPIRHATAYVTALGIADLHLNGQRVSDEWFNPGWTDYTRRVHYRAYDVTDQIRTNGVNVVGAVLADGWYSGYVGYGHMRDHYGKNPRVRAFVHLEYEDRSSEDVGTSSTWKAATGPIGEADFLMGESYDARKAMDGWDRPEFSPDGWRPVDVGCTEVQPVVQWHPGPPVRLVDAFRARSIKETSPGVYVLDLGQNFAGVPRLRLRGEPGQTITLRFAERLNPDGTIYTTNLRSARATDTYICRGSEVEEWTPRFTFHGFQYVEISGLKSPPTPELLVGVALSSDTPVVGSFECSDPVLNQLHSNIYWTQRSNFIDIPTDCPQRDERLGWTGDAQVYIRTATLNCDVQAFFTKWLQDLVDGQRADGQFPMVAPVKVAGDDGGPAWADAGVICPWTVYQVYGDRQLLERQYPAMVKFVEFCRSRSQDGVLPPREFHAFGDWLSINAETPREVIYTAYYAQSTRLVTQAAAVLGKDEDARRYQSLYDQIKQAFQQKFVSADGRIAGNTQACYVLALAFDLLDGEMAAAAARYLVEDIEKRGHLSTGFIGTKDLMLVLSKIGRNDVAYRLLQNDTFPSWGFSIKHGATSIWERWDGWTPEKGFQDPGMNSFAHYSFGAVYQWIVENVGGIRSTSPGYHTIEIAPQPGGTLTSARTVYRSIRGEIATDWKVEGTALRLTVRIPPNTSAKVIVRCPSPAAITETGRPLNAVPEIRVSGPARIGDPTTLQLGSGTYTFAVSMNGRAGPPG